MSVIRIIAVAIAVLLYLGISRASQSHFSKKYPNFIDLYRLNDPYGRVCSTSKTVVVETVDGNVIVEKEGFRLAIKGITARRGDTVFAVGTLTKDGLQPVWVDVVSNYAIKRGAMYGSALAILLLVLFHFLNWFKPPSIKFENG